MSLRKPLRAVVTGAGSGLGRGFCRALARRGARLVASDLDPASAEATVAALGGAEGHATRCDVSRLEEVEALAAFAEARLGGVDLLVNNAGVAVGGRTGEIPLDDWRWLMGVNLWGVIFGCHVFVPRMAAQGGGHLLNVASAAGLANLPLMAPYNVSKAGVIALSETLAGELKSRGIGVTVLCPTFFQTNIAESARGLVGGARDLATKLMAIAKLSADDVAAAALDAADAGRLYALPMAQARWIWRFKRLWPERFVRLGTRAMQSQARKLGIEIEI